MTCDDHSSDRRRDAAAAAAANNVIRYGGRRRGAGVWTTATAAAVALLALHLASAASTGGRGGDAVPAESKKLTSGKSAMSDGYVLTGSHLGDKGYNEDDAFGDKDSDSYGFGTQVSYGSRAGDGGDGAYHRSTAYDDNGRSKPKYSAWHFEEKDGRPTKRYVFDSHKKKKDPLAVEAEASEYDSVEAYDDGDDGSHAGYEVDDADPEYGSLYDSADAYNDADTYY